MKKLINKYQVGGWFPIGYDNNIYQSRIGMLPEVRVTAERPSWQRNLTDYDLARLRSGQISSETAKSIAEKRATGTSGFMKDVNKLSWIPNGAMILAGGLSGALANPYLWGALGLGSAAQNIEDKNYREAALDIGLTFLGPELQLLNKGVEATRIGKNARIASELNKVVKSTRLQPGVVENSVHNRFKLGDVEINNPNLMYHVDNGDYTGFSGNGAYVKDGMLFPSQHSNGQKPYTWWNLGSPYRNGQTRLLTTTKDNPSLLRVRDQDYPIGQWTGNPKDRTFVTNQEFVSSNPIKIGNQYVWEPGYGYRKYSTNSNTLPLKIVEKPLKKLIKPIVKDISKWTPEQWTAAQDVAIAKGDMAEAQRLRDLHFEVSAPNTQIKDIQYHSAKGNAKFNVFDPERIGQTDQGWAGRGYYFTPTIDYAKMYGSEPRAFYINAQKVHDGTASTYFGRENSPAANAFKRIRKKHGNDGQQILDELASSDAIRTSFPQTLPYNGIFEEVVTRNNNQMKLADAVTYDDNGVRIPLGERDNFNINDIRYSLLPFILGSVAIGESLK